MTPHIVRCPVQNAGELSAVLGAAYEAFLRARLERRAGRRGKVHARGVSTAVEMVVEMLAEAGEANTEALWYAAIAELGRDRGEIEADVLAHHGFAVPEHEWPAFLEYVDQRRGS